MQQLDKIISEKIESGFYQIAAFIFLVLIDLTDGGNIAIMTLILPTIENEFSLSSGAISLLTSVYFIGTAVGSMIVGKFSDKYGRRKIIMLGLIVQIVVSLAMCLCYNFYFLVFLRFIFGFSYGFSLPLTTVYITEIVPNKNRGKWILFINFFVTIGKLYGTLLGFFILEDLSHGDWRKLILISTILPAFILIIAWFFLIESLRFCFVNKKFDEFKESFNKLVYWNNLIPVYRNQKPSVALTDSDLKNLQTLEIEDEFTNDIASYKALIKEKYLKITILLWVILFNLNFMFFGQMAILPYLSIDSSKGITSILITISGEVPVIFLTYFMIDHPYFGRKNSIFYFSIGSLTTNLASFFLGDFGLGFFMFMTRFCMKGIFASVYPLTSEVYPTSFRSVGYGFASGVGRIGACLMPFFVFPLLEVSRYADFFVFGLNSFFCVVAAFLFPFDTAGRALDFRENMLFEMKELKEDTPSELMD